MKAAHRNLCIAATSALLASCAHHTHSGSHYPGGPMTAMHHGSPAATAQLEPTRGQQARGRVMFHQTADGVVVHARVSGLVPGQAHGFHVHEKGDCSSGDGMSTGGHFNPTNQPHGPQDGPRHAGDLPSLQADATGQAELRAVVKGLTIGSGGSDIVGRGLIVHAQPDDYRSQPTGNAGARIACAVIAAVR